MMIFKLASRGKINELLHGKRTIKKEFTIFRRKQRSIKLIYPDTLRYRDSYLTNFNALRF